MSLVQLDLFLRLIMSPLLIVTAILIMISSIKMWKKYHLDKTVCCTVLLAGIVLLVIGVADFITNPVRNI